MNDKIAICVPSNRPDSLQGFLESLDASGLRDMVRVVTCISPPFTGNEPFLSMAEDVVFCETSPKPVKFAKFRKLTFDKAKDAKYIWAMDCDNRFLTKMKGTRFNKGPVEYFNECIEFLEESPIRGALTFMSFNGGNHFGYDFLPVESYRFFGFGLGAIIKNPGFDLITEYESELAGSNEDHLVLLNLYTSGRVIYRRFNVPVTMENTKHHFGMSRAEKVRLDPNYADHNPLKCHIRETFSLDTEKKTMIGRTLELHIKNRNKLLGAE